MVIVLGVLSFTFLCTQDEHVISSKGTKHMPPNQTEPLQQYLLNSRTSVAGTLMPCLSWLFQTHSLVPKKKNPTALRICEFLGDFPFHIDNDMLCVLIRIASMRRF